MAALPGVAGDALRIVRERPAIAVGAGVAVLLAARFLNNSNAAPAATDPAAAAAGDASLGLGGAIGGSVSTIPYPGDGIGSGALPPDPTAPQAPAAPAAPAPTATLAPQWWPSWLSSPPASAVGAIAVPKSSLGYYSVSGTTAKAAGTLTTGGFSAYVDRVLNVTLSTGGTTTLVHLSTGNFAGRWIGLSRGTWYPKR